MAGGTTGSGEWPWRRPIEVSFRDLDVLGHVNHAVYLTWMENLRVGYFLNCAPSGRLEEMTFVLAEAAARYLKPVRFGQSLRGETAPGRVGRSSFSLLYRFLDPGSGEVLARGRTVQVMVEPGGYRSIPLTPELRSRLERDRVDPVSEGWESPSQT